MPSVAHGTKMIKEEEENCLMSTDQGARLMPPTLFSSLQRMPVILNF